MHGRIFSGGEWRWRCVSRAITEYQAENLKLDAKTLIDISRVLEMDGRFKAVPGILDSIAMDILEIVNDGDNGKEVVV